MGVLLGTVRKATGSVAAPIATHVYVVDVDDTPAAPLRRGQMPPLTQAALSRDGHGNPMLLTPRREASLSRPARDGAGALGYRATCAGLTAKSQVAGERKPDEIGSNATDGAGRPAAPPFGRTHATCVWRSAVEQLPDEGHRAVGAEHADLLGDGSRRLGVLLGVGRSAPRGEGPWPSRGGSRRGPVGRPSARTARRWRRSGGRRGRLARRQRRRRPAQGRWAG